MNRWSDAMLCMFVGGLIGIGLLVAMAWPAPQPALRDVSHAFASSRPGAVLNIASPEIERRIAPHQLRCNQPNSVIRVGPQVDATRPPLGVAERSRNVGPPSVQHVDGSQLFIFRVWLEREAFRPSTGAVDCEENRVFGEPIDLLHFLRGGGAADSTNPPTA